ncbi:hypothetical protein B9Q03_02840 [Candidatus Marsarchaeota G2 archaeon OSP_D]|jgi:Predicted acetyltransferase|uniref:N-acetyltransferase domain-containing protein n=4 Tax=Candidatus Marsarchaeota group 2 TaxID=2203771 RepID=A0A2R6BAX1_9ARCH|nr:MAG: hypothetical protein B9Q03_02840 [Candidatus Marsarchaeota G2 archaeon OSP_D]PSN95810.1 MAG: hypothetical protein B9Q06_04325 [Candidatus Marsarchaeota G2 archaeon ECH_B_2]PSO00580.1 MAG: hypothetical protein B9Q07_03155 [Candidatus Marsarchaeota G2 archaeon ECH_B_3]PSO03175.1 MAG: hypothetical protein B9Q05_02195 [Candidatus Marsarchaeota G2 archaeon ECH_B_1]
MNNLVRSLFLTDPVKFAFEIYDSGVDDKYTEFIIINEGYLMFYRKFNPITAILYAEKETTAEKLLTSIREDTFILFIEPKWKYLLNFPNAKTYPEVLMMCKSPLVLRREGVRGLTVNDAEEILKLYGEERGNTLIQMIRENKTTAYGLFLDDNLVSAAYTLVETKDVAVIGGVLTSGEFRNKGFASSVVSSLTENIVKKGKVASLYVREDNIPAIHVYAKIGFKEHSRRLWVSVNTEVKPL